MQKDSHPPLRAASRHAGELVQGLGAALVMLCVVPVSVAVWTLAIWAA